MYHWSVDALQRPGDPVLAVHRAFGVAAAGRSGGVVQALQQWARSGAAARGH